MFDPEASRDPRGIDITQLIPSPAELSNRDKPLYTVEFPSITPTYKKAAPYETTDLAFPNQTNLFMNAFRINREGDGILYLTPDKLREATYAWILRKYSEDPEVGRRITAKLMKRDMPGVVRKMRVGSTLAFHQMPILMPILGSLTNALDISELYRNYDLEFRIGIFERRREAMEELYEQKFRRSLPTQFYGEQVKEINRATRNIALLTPEAIEVKINPSNATFAPHELLLISSALLQRRGEPFMGGFLIDVGQWSKIQRIAQEFAGSKTILDQDPAAALQIYGKLVAVVKNPYEANLANRFEAGRFMVDLFSAVPSFKAAKFINDLLGQGVEIV